MRDQEAFLLWAVFIVIHLPSYLPKLPRMLSGRAGQAQRVLAARATRWLLLGGALAAGLALALAAGLALALAAGLALALATYHLAGAWGGSGRLMP
jgi:hypothetical protein